MNTGQIILLGVVGTLVLVLIVLQLTGGRRAGQTTGGTGGQATSRNQNWQIKPKHLIWTAIIVAVLLLFVGPTNIWLLGQKSQEAIARAASGVTTPIDTASCRTVPEVPMMFGTYCLEVGAGDWKRIDLPGSTYLWAGAETRFRLYFYDDANRLMHVGEYGGTIRGCAPNGFSYVRLQATEAGMVYVEINRNRTQLRWDGC